MLNDVFISDDGSVVKFIHGDGSETAIKVVKSCSNFMDKEGNISVEFVDRGKYSIFISHSMGCPVGCKFCHLTIKDSAYKKLTVNQVEENIKEALLYEVERNPKITSRFVKLCWMGMGDGLLNSAIVRDVTKNITTWIIDNDLASGIDSIDISTVFPTTSSTCLSPIVELNTWVNQQNFKLNPNSHKKEQAEIAAQSQYTDRSVVRVFFSLHSAIETSRKNMVPIGAPLSWCKEAIRYFLQCGVNVLFHQVFVEGLNDTREEVEALINFMENFKEQEFRILRYNFCNKSKYKEWDKVSEVANTLISAGLNVKVQISAGKEVSAACGQFLVAITKQRPNI